MNRIIISSVGLVAMTCLIPRNAAATISSHPTALAARAGITGTVENDTKKGAKKAKQGVKKAAVKTKEGAEKVADETKEVSARPAR